MTLAFYKVSNSQGYDRNEFDCDTTSVIKEKLSRLSDDELKVYDMNNYGWKGNTPSPNIADFVEDYNDEELDGGWWCVCID